MGFMPVPGTGTISPAAAGQTPAAAEASPLGLFDALLQLALGQAAPTAPAGDQAAALGALLAAKPDGTTELTVPEPAEDEETVADLLAGLLEALTAIEQSVQNGTAVDPALEQQVTETIDKLAALLGFAPAGPAADPAASSQDTLDLLAAIKAAATTPAVDPASTPDGAGADDIPAADAPKPVLPPLVEKLVTKIEELAEAIEARSPALAEKLAALADKIGSGELDAETLSKLGLTPDLDGPGSEIESAILRLLGATPEAKPAQVAAAAPFTTATLALPEVAKTKSAPATPPADTTLETSDAETDLDPKIEMEARPEPRADKADNSQPKERSTFAVTMQASAADPSTPSQPAAQATTAITAATADTKATQAAYSAPMRQINMPQVAFEIVRHVQAGASRFQIRLDPPELGRVDVKLDVDASGNVNARMTVERAETLDLMQRDQRTLERALAQAGLDSSKTNLEFSLRQNPFAQQEQGQGQRGHARAAYASAVSGAADAGEAAPPPHIIAYRGSAAAGGVNLFV